MNDAERDGAIDGPRTDGASAPSPADLLVRNRAWAAERERAKPGYFHGLAALQRPTYLWIGCSDSRVPANVITGLEPGEVFVHRNVANLVHRGDLNLLSVVEFAVQTLGVEHVILCGHHGCGGVRAALETIRHGIVDHWLQPIRDVADAGHAELDDIADPERRLDRLCELSVAAQVRDLSRTPIIEQAWRAGRRLAIHGWVYRLEDGLLRDLGCTLEGRPAGVAGVPAGRPVDPATPRLPLSASERTAP